MDCLALWSAGGPPEAPFSVSTITCRNHGGTACRINATASANARRGVPDRRIARRRRVVLWPPQPDASNIDRQGSAVPDPAYTGYPETRWACGSWPSRASERRWEGPPARDSGDTDRGGPRGVQTHSAGDLVPREVYRP